MKFPIVFEKNGKFDASFEFFFPIRPHNYLNEPSGFFETRFNCVIL